MRLLSLFALFFVPWAMAAESSMESAIEVRPYLHTSFNVQSKLGYETPAMPFGGGIEVSTRYSLTELSGDYCWCRKIETKDGHSTHFGSSQYVRLGNLLIGGGYTHGHQVTSAWEKSASSAFIGGGADLERLRLRAGWVLPYWDKSNGLRGVQAQIEYRASRRFSLDYGGGFYMFHTSNQPESAFHYAPQLKIGLRFYLR